MATSNTLNTLNTEADETFGANDYLSPINGSAYHNDEYATVNASSLIKSDKTVAASAQSKKITRLFNVTNQSSISFLKASNVLLNPFSMNERKMDNLSAK